ncbi:MAG: dihydrofolate reductase family protein [Chloroflexota bacterium]
MTATMTRLPDAWRPDAGGADWRIEPVWQAPPDPHHAAVRGGVLPGPLAERYAAELAIPLRTDRPTVVANFVATMDGVVSFAPLGPSGGRAVSGDFEPDRFLMGLLRATADAILVGAGTVRASRTRSWTPDRVHPPSAEAFAGWRRDLGLPATPTAVLLTSSGIFDPDASWRPRGDQPVVALTTTRGAARLRADGVPGAAVVADGPDGRLAMADVLSWLADRGHRLVLCEAGPTVFGELLAAGLVDELFLTVAPRVAGRDGASVRPGIVAGVAFEPANLPSATLRSVMRSGDHLFLRHAFRSATPEEGGPR